MRAPPTLYEHVLENSNNGKITCRFTLSAQVYTCLLMMEDAYRYRPTPLSLDTIVDESLAYACEAWAQSLITDVGPMQEAGFNPQQILSLSRLAHYLLSIRVKI